MEDTKNPRGRPRSPLGDLDRDQIRLLSDLHPWGLGRLCAAVDMTQSVLSHVCAGRRPLPQRVANKFLPMLGLSHEGTLDPEHLFVLNCKGGNQPKVEAMLERLFPGGADVVELSDLPIDQREGVDLKSSEPRFGFALSDGQFAAVVLGTSAHWLTSAAPNRWRALSEESGAGHLLDGENPPTKAQVTSLVGGVMTFEKYVMDDPTWELVKQRAVEKGLAAEGVLALVDASPGHAIPDGAKTLFPSSRQHRRKGAESGG